MRSSLFTGVGAGGIQYQNLSLNFNPFPEYAQGSFGGIQSPDARPKWCHWNLPKETVYKWGHASATPSVLRDVLYT